MEAIRVVITGLADPLTYWLAYLVANGNVFGVDQMVIINFYSSEKEQQFQSIINDLLECAFVLLCQVMATNDPAIAFYNVSGAFLNDVVVRRKDMDRQSFLTENAKIFRAHGRALNKYANKRVKVLVTGSLCNTNAFICSYFGCSIPKENFSALSRLNQNRATYMLARYLDIPVNAVSNVIVWGSNSPTQYADIRGATLKMNNSIQKVVKVYENDMVILNGFDSFIQEHLHSKDVAMATAKAACDHMLNWWQGTDTGQCVSMAVISDGSYGIPADIVFSFPVKIKNTHWKIVHNLPMEKTVQDKLNLTARELVNEKCEALEAFKAI